MLTQSWHVFKCKHKLLQDEAQAAAAQAEEEARSEREKIEM
jgi:hypothetical protein